jgi:hypothetical protein
MSVPDLPNYLWPDPHQPGWWIDAWNGIYNDLEMALQDAAGGVGRPWTLRHGEGVVDEAEVERRLAKQAEHQRSERMLQQLSTTLHEYQEGHVADLEIKATARTVQNSVKQMTASWDRTMQAIERAAHAIEQAANRWEEKASDMP